MSRYAKWVGGALVAAAIAGLAGYFAAVGLEEADRLGSVLGVFIGLAGLALALYGIVNGRRSEPRPPPLTPPPAREAEAPRTHNQISGGVFNGPVIQARDVDQTRSGSAPAKPSPPGPDDDPERRSTM